MKEWTKELLDKYFSYPVTGSPRKVINGAGEAAVSIHFPAEQLAEIVGAVAGAQKSIPDDVVAAFTLGLATGWAEHEESVK